MRDLCLASVSALHSDRNRASANASAVFQTRHVLRLWLIVVNRELAPGDGTNPLLLPVDSLLYFRSLPPISGISRDDAESEIESWRIELRLARSQSASTFCPRFAVAFNCSAHKEPPRSVAAASFRCSRVSFVLPSQTEKKSGLLGPQIRSQRFGCPTTRVWKTINWSCSQLAVKKGHWQHDRHICGPFVRRHFPPRLTEPLSQKPRCNWKGTGAGDGP